MKKISNEEYKKIYDENKDNLALHSCWTEEHARMTAWTLRDDDDECEPLLQSEYHYPGDKSMTVSLEDSYKAQCDGENWQYWTRDIEEERN